MGGIITAPLQLLSSCLGTCAGTCLSVSCFQLADSGTVSTAQAVRCVLAWLQVFGTLLALAASSASIDWLSWTCNLLQLANLGDFGICECRDAGDTLRVPVAPAVTTIDVESIDAEVEAAKAACWHAQLVYRATAATSVLFLLLLLLSVAGCATGAARFHEVGKFMAIVLFSVLSMLLPNAIFTGYGEFAVVLAAGFLLAQTVQVIDVAYHWNEAWFSLAKKANASKAHLGGILVAAAVLLLVAAAVDVHLVLSHPEAGARALVIVVACLGLAGLILSITEWCKHGSLLTSATMALYTAWLLQEALLWSGANTAAPSDRTLLALRLLFCSVSIAILGMGVAETGTSSEDKAQGLLQDSERGTTVAVAPRTGAGLVMLLPMLSAQDRRSFTLQCAFHSVVPLYLCAAIAPARTEDSHMAYWAHAAVALACPLLYGWSLIAPKLLTSRTF